MLIGVVGLGLIGGSFAKAYSAAGHDVLAADTDKRIIGFAKISGVCKGELTSDNLKDCDLILICVYQNAAIAFLEENRLAFGNKCIVIDCCGIKRDIVQRGMALAAENGFTYLGGHPMAGTQYSGFKYSKETLFQRASMVIVPPDFNDIALLERAKELLSPAGFSKITVTDAETHDAMIAYTSQLAHIVSNAYIKSPTVRGHKGLSAGSYRDLTRVARLNPDMWTELCICNRDNLIKELSFLSSALEEYKIALENGDAVALKKLFAEGSKIKEEVDG